MSLIEIHIHSDVERLDKILKLLTKIGANMATQADIDRLNAKAEKILTEVQTTTDALRAQIAELQAQNPALDLSMLEETLSRLDNLNPDAGE